MLSLAAIFCIPAGSSNKSNKDTSSADSNNKEVKLTVSSAGLVTVENCKSDYTVKLVNGSYARGLSGEVNTRCRADLVWWVDKPYVGEPYVEMDRTLSSKDKGRIYILGDKETCELVACGKKIT